MIGPPSDQPDNDASSPSRTELALVLALTVIALGLRINWLSRVSVEHFDEGVYASNYWFFLYHIGAAHYPEQQLYAPPLLPWLIEWTFLLGRPSRFGAVWMNLAAGTLTVPLVWWMGRRWFGGPAGVAAATLATFSDFHALYSRTSLTDALLCFWLALAVYLAWKAMLAQRAGWTVAAGLVTGLAWWTKYTGWLPLAISLAGAAACVLVQRPGRRFVLQCLGRWALIAAIAFATWCPYLFSLRDAGGYSVVAENHRRYLVGIGEWWHTLRLQAVNLQQFDGWLTCGGLALAVLLAAAVRSSECSTWNASRATFPLGMGMLLMALASLVGVGPMLGILSLAGFVFLWRQSRTSDGDSVSSNRTLAAWMLAAWFVGLLASTPLYHAYPRLTLPWIVVSWLAAGSSLGFIARRLSGAELRVAPHGATPPGKLGGAVGAIGVLLVCSSLVLMLATGSTISARGVPAWQSRTGLERASHEAYRRVLATQPTDLGANIQDVVVSVYGEPAVVYHLSYRRWLFENENGVGAPIRVHAIPVGDVGFSRPNPPVPTYLVIGPHALSSPDFVREWTTRKSAFREIGRFPYQPSALVRLDQHPGTSLDAVNDNHAQGEIQVWMVR